MFFANSGAEAAEGAIKTARKFHAVNGNPERYRIITFEGAFHGRTLATLAAGGQKKYLEGFGPVVEGFDQVPFGDLAAVKGAIGPTTAAILIEPIQEGEEAACAWRRRHQFLRQLRALADRNGLLLIFSTRCRPASAAPGRAVRLSTLRASTPDIMSARQGAWAAASRWGRASRPPEAAKGMTAGTHEARPSAAIRSLAMAAGTAVLDIMLAARLPRAVAPSRGLLLKQRLASKSIDRHPAVIAEVRGLRDCLIGLRAALGRQPASWSTCAMRDHELRRGPAAGDNVVRLVPPLNVTEAEIAEAVARIRPRLPVALERRQKPRPRRRSGDPNERSGDFPPFLRPDRRFPPHALALDDRSCKARAMKRERRVRADKPSSTRSPARRWR